MTTTEPRAGRREWIGLGVLLLPLLLVSMDVSVLFFAVPYIGQDLEPTSTEQLWIFDIYGFVLSGLLITMGAVGDRIGRRKLLMIGAAGFGLVSVAAAYSGSAAMLIGARAVLGIAGATLMPSTLALTRNMFHDAKQRSTAVAIWTAGLTSGVALGPILSGLLLRWFWWGSVFLVNVPFMVLLLVLAPLLVPEFRNRAAGRFDVLSSVLSLAAVLPVIWGIKELAAHGVDAVRIASIAVGVGFGAGFVVRQRRLRHPMIDLALFRRRAFGASVGVNVVAMFAMGGFAIFSTQYLQSVLGFSPLVGALWSLLPTLVVGAAAPVAGQLAQRGVPRNRLMAAGFLIAAVGFAVLTQLPVDGLVWLMVGAGLEAAGLVVVMSLGTELVMGAAPPERAGTASAVSETGSEFGGALGIAILGSIGTAIYRSTVDLPAHTPPAAGTAARQTLEGAVQVAGQLPAQAGDALRHAARVAFTHGLHAAAVTGLAVMLAGAVLAVTTLRGARPADATVPEQRRPEPAPVPTDA